MKITSQIVITDTYNSKRSHNDQLEYIKSKTTQNISRSKSMVFLGHKDWNLALNMMIGLQMAVKSTVSFADYEIQEKDFKLMQYFQLVPK